VRLKFEGLKDGSCEKEFVVGCWILGTGFLNTTAALLNFLLLPYAIEK